MANKREVRKAQTKWIFLFGHVGKKISDAKDISCAIIHDMYDCLHWR